MSILVKAGTGLAAGIVAGALGLAFFPRVEPTALTPRNAVEKPQFVAAVPSPAAVAANRAAPALAIASEAVAEKPAKPADVAPEPKVAETKPTPVALASLEAPKGPAKSPALGESRGLSFAALPSATPSPLASAAPPKPAPAEVRAPQAAPATASDESARWSVRGLLALAKGDLSSARLYLTRAADAGDPRALVALADTYDPAMLTKLGVVVAPGDAQKAKDLLVKAAAAGVFVAKDRMAALDVR